MKGLNMETIGAAGLYYNSRMSRSTSPPSMLAVTYFMNLLPF